MGPSLLCSKIDLKTYEPLILQMGETVAYPEFPGCTYIVVVQLPSCDWLLATPWTAAYQASLSITNSQSLLKLMSIELVMSSNHLILCLPFSSCLQSFPASGPFPVSQFFTSGGQSTGASASASVLPVNIQRWFPLGLTGLISFNVIMLHLNPLFVFNKMV